MVKLIEYKERIIATVDAESESEAQKKATAVHVFVGGPKLEVLNTKVTGPSAPKEPAYIVDAEELLFAMDTEGCDAITTIEGLGGKVVTTVTRKQVTDQITREMKKLA